MAKKIKELSKDKLNSQEEFLNYYKISQEDFNSTSLLWENLDKIFNDYIVLRNKLDLAAKAIVDILFSQEARISGVHSVRYRIKDPHGLIEKIIRKKIENPNREINIDNYRDEITDLIGIRALHTFKDNVWEINQFIRSTFHLKNDEPPIHYYHKGDADSFLEVCKEMGCFQKVHPNGYRSIHYIISTQLTKDLYHAEIQVRTIFDEGWSEIDHKIRYSYKNSSVTPFDSELDSLNKIIGAANDIGSNIKKLDQEEQRRILGKVKGK